MKYVFFLSLSELEEVVDMSTDQLRKPEELSRETWEDLLDGDGNLGQEVVLNSKKEMDAFILGVHHMAQANSQEYQFYPSGALKEVRDLLDTVKKIEGGDKKLATRYASHKNESIREAYQEALEVEED